MDSTILDHSGAEEQRNVTPQGNSGTKSDNTASHGQIHQTRAAHARVSHTKVSRQIQIEIE